MAVPAIPEGYHSVTPYLVVEGGVQDACGNQWWIGTHQEDVPADELARRAQAAMSPAAT